ncbi:YdeI/OmpD-associated family protein [Allopontixanthobacter sp.]|uniref:YdeI/OmpD-associated family protein n=1 Tax=Allopontixanthobacter sp. TaxID=2906452 RepID=UPI002ABB7B78|nr:YdeI/OmpD-associated family protein [Allopontixanthobacter sp.]MDZ4307945.1 YdeI/OmpD-associated family protein [Allopontixanthobacter sp.]
MNSDVRIDEYIAAARPFAPILNHLRKLIRQAVPDGSETIKWGMPHITVGGKNLVAFAAFKKHASLVIHNRPADSEGMGHFGKLTSLADLPADEAIIETLRQARADLEAGVRPVRQRTRNPKPEIPVPDDFAAALQSAPAASAVFDSLAPSHRREYLEWITEAKRSETRTRRIATAIEWLAEGKKRNWKYESC